MVLERAAAQGRECFGKRESLERKIESFLNTCLEVSNRPISKAYRGKRIEYSSRNVLLIVLVAVCTAICNWHSNLFYCTIYSILSLHIRFVRKFLVCVLVCDLISLSVTQNTS